MSEVAPRGAPRSRGSFRGGRGGHSSRGGRGGRPTAGDKATPAEPVVEDEGEIGQLKSKYASSIKIVQEMFPDWSHEDIVFAIEENGGDLEQTISRMSDGNVSQWGEVKKKDKTKVPKGKDTVGSEPTAPARGGRGRGGAESARGGRGRATERGRGVSRTARGASTANGRISKTSEPTTAETAPAESAPAAEPTLDSTAAWGSEAPAATSPADSWEVVAPAEAAPVAEASRATPKPDGTRTWASMLKPAPKPKPVPVAKPAAPVVPQAQELPAPPTEPEAVPEPKAEFTPAVPSVIEPNEQIAPSAPPSLPPSEPNTATIAPSEDKLTEENLELVKDVSHPVHSDTVASTMGTEEPRSLVGTPLHGASVPAARPGLGGFATSALKATQGGSRASSFRRVKDQQEAVVMPGNHAVDRTAVQFGSLGLSGSDDVDDDREEAETRAQPPQHSPIAPRASLPAAAQQPTDESAPTPRAAPGLPSNGPSDLPQVAQNDSQPPAPGHYDQFSNRFGGLPGAQAPGATNVSKSYEPFGQQLAGSGHHSFENYPSQSQAPGQQNQTAQSTLGSFGGSGYEQYYNDYQRNAHLYGGFGQQPGQAPQESGSSQRAVGAFGSSATDPSSQYATSHAPHNRFAGASDALNSGHSTPAPGTGHQSQTQAPVQGHNQSQGHGQGQGQQHSGHGHAAAPYGGNYGQYAMYNNSPFSYGQAPSQAQQQHQQNQTYGRDRPAFDDARRYEEYSMSNQANHYGYGGYGGYQSGPYSGGKYGQPHQYGTSYDGHGASPANTFGRDSAAGGFGYGRTSSTQPDSSQHGQHQSSAYGVMNDPFGRSASAFTGQNSSQQGQGAPGDENSRFGTDSGKIATGGPSPAPAQQRPDSAINTSQSSQPQGQHAYSNYPQALGGFGSGHQGGHQAGHQGGHQQGGYSGFGGAGYGYSYGTGNRGGWGGYGGGH